MSFFENIGNAFKNGWNNGNLAKGFQVVGIAAMTGAMVDAAIQDSKHSCCCDGGSIFSRRFGGYTNNNFGNFNMYNYPQNSYYYGNYSFWDNNAFMNNYTYQTQPPTDPNQYPTAEQQDFAKCKRLFSEYKFGIIDGQYCCRTNRKDSNGLLKADSPLELLNKIHDLPPETTTT